VSGAWYVYAPQERDDGEDNLTYVGFSGADTAREAIEQQRLRDGRYIAIRAECLQKFDCERTLTERM
jgi:hypothetical protein